jgi:penicillin-binding protein 1A
MLNPIKQSPKLRWSLVALASLITLFFIFYFSIFFSVFGKIPSTHDLRGLEKNKTTQVLSSEGNLIGKYYIFDRQPVSPKQISIIYNC